MQAIIEKGIEINGLVHQFFCFGSTNKGVNIKTQAKFHQFLKMMTNLLVAFTDNIDQLSAENKLRILKRIPEVLHEAISKVVVRTQFLKWHLPDNPYFKQNKDFCAMFPLDLLTNADSIIWKAIQFIYPATSKQIQLRWEDDLPASELKSALYHSLLPSIGDYIWMSDLVYEPKNHHEEAELLQYLHMNAAQDLKALPEFQPAFNERFFEQNFKFMLRDVKRSVLKYGQGACEIMADATLLIALDLNLPGKLTYVRFINSQDPRIEELNTIAIGNWPEKDTVLISPWLGEGGKCIVWQGSIEQTPELSTGVYQGLYDRSVIKFKVDNEDHKAQLRQQVIEAGYRSWLTNPARKKNMRMIQDATNNFIQGLEKYGYIPQTFLTLAKR